jgi:glycosyltransferase involved in cell wall biosynthesis
VNLFLYVNTSEVKFLTRVGASSEIVTFVANGADTETFQSVEDHRERRIRRPFGLSITGVLTLSVGRFAPKNGYDKQLLPPSGVISSLWSGAPPPEDAEALHGIIFFGTRSPKKMADAYRVSDVFVLPSRSERFPLTLQEAMTSGLPITTSGRGMMCTGLI